MAYTLMQLPFKPDALEPFMDQETVLIHHGKHHQTYVDKLNAAVEKHPELFARSVEQLIADLSKVPEDIRTAVRNMGGGVANHDFFWHGIRKDVKIGSDIEKAIVQQFGSFEQFKESFTAAAVGAFGSGWAWLVLHDGKLEIMTTQNQDSPLSVGKVPLLTIDVWEHAYYLKYRNKRADFVEAYYHLIDWGKVEERYHAAKGRGL